MYDVELMDKNYSKVFERVFYVCIFTTLVLLAVVGTLVSRLYNTIRMNRTVKSYRCNFIYSSSKHIGVFVANFIDKSDVREVT